MKKTCTVLFTLAIAGLAPALAFAGPAGNGAPHPKAASTRSSAEPLHVQVARAIFPRENWRRFLTQASAELTQQIAETGKGQIELAPGFADRLREQYEEMVPYEEMLGYQARLLDSQYSKAELRQLLAFYRTPLGRRSVPFMHDLMASSMQRAELKVQNELSGVLTQLRPLVRRLPSAADPDDAQQQSRAESNGAADDEDHGTGSGQPANGEPL